MSGIDPYLGQIEIFAFPFAPEGWALCNGQLLSINANVDLFSLLGTTFGGDGQTTFALPDLRARTPIGQGNGPGLTPRVQGERIGEEVHTLTPDELAMHSHRLAAEPSDGTTAQPAPLVIIAKSKLRDEAGAISDLPIYVPDITPTVAMHPATIQPAGGNQPHNNMMPFLTVSVCISLTGPKPPSS